MSRPYNFFDGGLRVSEKATEDGHSSAANDQETAKEIYETPRLVRHGTVEELTNGLPVPILLLDPISI
jgi:hypothetical protein